MSINFTRKSEKNFCWYCHLPNSDVDCKFCDKLYHYDCLESVGLEILDLKCMIISIILYLINIFRNTLLSTSDYLSYETLLIGNHIDLFKPHYLNK